MSNTQAALVEALKQAEAGLEFAGADQMNPTGDFVPTPLLALRAVRAALAQAEAAQPVAWCSLTPNGHIEYFNGKPMVMPGPVGNEMHQTPLFAGATPQPAEAAPTADLARENAELRHLLAVRVAGALLYVDDGELQDSSELPAIDFKRDTPGEISRKLTDRGLKKLTKAARVHALVNAGPYPGMSEAFDAHMGAACWTDPAYRQDAATWAAAWKAALSAAEAAPKQEAVLLPEKDIRDIANGLNGLPHSLGQWQRDLAVARAVEAKVCAAVSAQPQQPAPEAAK